MSTHLAHKPSPAPADIAGEAEEISVLLRRLLTAVPAAEPRPAAPRSTPLWVYLDHDGRWCVREEGGKFEAAFASRDRAAACARAAGHAAGSYTLFLQLKDGRVIEEYFNLGQDPSAPKKGGLHRGPPFSS